MKAKAPPPVADINVTPMVDVMLVLLIIFMVITPMLSKGVPVDMVKTKNPIAMQAADKSDAVWWRSPGTGKFISVLTRCPGRSSAQGEGSAAPTSWTRRCS
jgi:hypothetical protein